MEIQDTVYFIAGDDQKEFIFGFESDNKRIGEEMEKLAAKYGGKPVHNGHHIIGLYFPDNDKSGWSHKGSLKVGDGYKHYFFPKQSSKEGRTIAKDLQSVRLRHYSELHKEFCGSSWGENSGPVPNRPGATRMRYASYERIGNQIVIGIPMRYAYDGESIYEEGDKSAVEYFENNKAQDCLRLTMSHYWKMREEAEDK